MLIIIKHREGHIANLMHLLSAAYKDFAQWPYQGDRVYLLQHLITAFTANYCVKLGL